MHFLVQLCVINTDKIFEFIFSSAHVSAKSIAVLFTGLMQAVYLYSALEFLFFVLIPLQHRSMFLCQALIPYYLSLFLYYNHVEYFSRNCPSLPLVSWILSLFLLLIKTFVCTISSLGIFYLNLIFLAAHSKISLSRFPLGTHLTLLFCIQTPLVKLDTH